MLNWRQLTAIEVGGAICLPVIMIGHKLGMEQGLLGALSGILLGNVLLLLLSLVSVQMGFERKLKTADNAYKYLGPFGQKMFGGCLLFSKTCWFALQLNMIALSTHAVFPYVGETVMNLLLGVLIILCALLGIQALSAIASLSLPLMVGTMAFAALRSTSGQAIVEEPAFSLGGISLVIAAAITAVIDMPTYFRHARSLKDCRIAAILFLGIAVPAIELLGVYLMQRNPGATLVQTLQGGGGALWEIWIALFLLLAGWTTNNTNLYSATNSMTALIPSMKEKKATALIGVTAVALALAGALHHFSLILQLIGILIGSMGVVVLTQYALEKRGYAIQEGKNLLIWGCAVLIGMGALFKVVHLSSIPLIDAGGSALIASLLFTLNQKRVPDVITS